MIKLNFLKVNTIFVDKLTMNCLVHVWAIFMPVAKSQFAFLYGYSIAPTMHLCNKAKIEPVSQPDLTAMCYRLTLCKPDG